MQKMRKKEGLLVIEVVAAMIWQGNRFLLCQRPAHKARGLQWEFVGGKVEPGESREQALIRECREELGMEIAVEQPLRVTEHVYPDVTIRLTLFRASIATGAPQLLEHAAMAWVTPAQAAEYALCPADRELLEGIQGTLD